MASMKQVPGKPGVFQVSTAEGTKAIKLVEWREDYIYDTVEILAALIPAGQQWQFFQNLQNKLRVDTNLRTMRKLSSGQEMILNQIGVQPCHNYTTGAECLDLEYAFVCERLHYLFEINSIPMAEGPVHCFPAGMGVVGSVAAAGIGVLNNGVPSPAAVPRLLVPQNIYADNDIAGTLTHHSALAWTASGYVASTPTGGILVRNLLRGYVKTAVGKG